MTIFHFCLGFAACNLLDERHQPTGLIANVNELYAAMINSNLTLFTTLRARANRTPRRAGLSSKAILRVLLLAGVAISSLHSEETNRYNVLFIAVDDLRPELGCYGADYVQSPNIDRLAKQGTLFTHHYVQVPTCGASRYAMLTGRSPVNSGVVANNEALYNGPAALKPEQQPGAQSLPEQFRRSGYRTVCIGKISHTGDGRVFAYNGKGTGDRNCLTRGMNWPRPWVRGGAVGVRFSPTRAVGIARTARAIGT